MKFLLLVLVLMTHPAMALEGIYSGYIKLYEPKDELVPLQVSLSFTGERVFTPRGDERPVIDASLLIGEEGGPYAASNVDLDVDDARIDIRYERPKNNMSDTSPSNFRLIGDLKSQNRIEGRVLSGTRGPVGTFVLEKSRSEIFTKNIIFQGHWFGQAQLTDGTEVPFEIHLTPTPDATINPSDYEFEYSLGKVAAIRWHNTRLAFDKVYVDYLRKQIYMFKTNARGESGISLRFTLHSDGSVTGKVDSSLRGTMATFNLKP